MGMERPSLLDETDFAVIGSRPGRSERRPDRMNRVKLAVAAVLFAAAGIAISYPYWKPDGTGQKERVVAAAERTAEDEAEFNRQQHDTQVVLQQGGVRGSE